jgi:hypothetical protein
MFCRYCGTANPDDSRFCRICGKEFEGTTSILTPDSSTPFLPLPGIPASGIQPVAENVPTVQGTPQSNNIPSVQGTPSSPGGHSGAASGSPLSSPAPRESFQTPHASAPSVPTQTPHASAPSVPTHVTHPFPKEHSPGQYPSHLHSRAEHHSDTRPLSESQSQAASQQSMLTQQALYTGVKVAGHVSRRAFLIALGGAAAVTVGVGTVVYVKNAISTPEKTISTFLEAVKRRDGQTAYEQLSSRLQSQINEQQYISSINLVGGFIGSYNISNIQENNTTATASVSFTAIIITANYSVELVKENGVWKIDGGTLINFH